jgi:hypothetical protein
MNKPIGPLLSGKDMLDRRALDLAMDICSAARDPLERLSRVVDF